MPRKKKAKKLTLSKSSPTKTSPDLSKKIGKDALTDMKKWIEKVRLAKNDYQFDGDIMEINSDEESDEVECNLKVLEKPLKTLLRKFPDSFIRKRVNLECEWNKCAFETTDESSYNNHVHDHLMPLANSELQCLWNLCKFETEDRTELLRHLDYHAYHTRLKTFGLGLVNIIAVPNCHADSRYRNVIPPTANDYFCYWNDCSTSYTKFNEFIGHVNHHLVLDYDTGVSVHRHDREILRNIKVTCRWNGCERELGNVFELKRHLKSHTKEKLIGCANCGTCFINKPMFIDHCLRQVVNQRSFQCPDCFKFYPSEKLLKDHTRSHVNKFQCSLCGLSWQKKSVLARHILYRHMTEKAFACEECSYKGKTQRDLEAHSNTHKTGDDNLYKCEVFQCDYSSRTLMALKRHDAKDHLGQPQTYQCHCCVKTYTRGYLLSKHLIRVHAFKLAPGHSRFIYKQDFDGFYRLQTKRVENLKEIPQPVVQFVEEDSNMDISYEIDNITAMQSNTTPINVQMKRVTRPKALEIPTFQLLTEDSTEDSKDINDFAIVRNYKKIIKRKKLEEG